MRPLQQKCPTLRGNKDDKERQQTITCQNVHPNTGYLLHLMYAYITQGRPDRGLPCLTPRAQAIITQRIGVYAAPLLQPTQMTTRTAQGNPIYVYHPTAISRLPIPSDTDIIYVTDASGTQQRTPTVGCASVRITWHADGLHVEHHTGATIFRASSHGELRTLADAVTATPPPATIRPRNFWLVVDATVDIHLTRRLLDLPPHKTLESGLTTQALGLWVAFRGMHPQDALHIVKQESHRYTYGNGRADTHAKHQSPSHTPRLKHVRLDIPHHSHLQHLPPIPSATQPPQWIPEDTPYTDRDKQYHYPTTIPQLATTLGNPANTELLRRLKDSAHTPLYYSALRPDSLPAHLQKPRLQLALDQLPLLVRYHRWYARRSIDVPAGYTKCICGHAEEETWDHFKVCPLYRRLDTLTDWNPTHTIAQHAGWLTRSPATQQLTTVLKQTEVLEAVRRGLVRTAVYTLLRTHAEDPQATAAHMQRMAVAKTAEQLTYRTHKYLQHAATLPYTDQAHLLKLLFYQPWEPTPRHTDQHGTPPTSNHHPSGTTPARHAAAPQALHTGQPACARRQPPVPHATVRPQVPPIASHRMPPLRTPAATTNGPTLQLIPLGLPGSRTSPHPLPPLQGPQPPPPRAACRPSCTPPPPATPASSGHSATPSRTTREGTNWRMRRITHGP